MARDWQTAVEHLDSVGPSVAYVGFSMGALFGFWTVAAMPSITTAVFVSGGIPSGDWTDDPGLESAVVDAARRLAPADVLMLNMTDDALFPASDVRLLFDSITASSKDLQFWDGGHDDWSPELIDASIAFLNISKKL
jgi:pimeloyl-ACP methyl ester carboxylesterase